MFPFFAVLLETQTAEMAPLGLVPAPQKVEMRAGSFLLAPEARIAADAALVPTGQWLSRTLSPATGYALPVVKAARKGDVRLKLNAKLQLGDEGYRMTVKPDGVLIEGKTSAGVFYGCQTLRQMLPKEVFRRMPVARVSWSVPCASIEDQPRFGWRGAMIDPARHFLQKTWVMKFIDAIALMKINHLHIHLSDDPGWRIEVKRYPKLTELGSKGDFSLMYQGVKVPVGRPLGGFYTQDDMREIVAYAAERHITVMPEFDVPGHSAAAILSYRELGIDGKSNNVLNAEESTIQFYKNVIDEMLEIFPGAFFHVGGDEVDYSQWKRSPRAQELIKQRGLKDEEELEAWIIKQLDQHLASKGRRLVGWDEILNGGLAPGATVMSWRGINGGIAAAKAGHDAIMAPTSYTYLDYNQTTLSASQPPTIGGYVDLPTAYSFEPVPKELNAEEAKHILGLQGQMWGEYMTTPYQVEHMAFPRLCALAEVGWSPKEQRNFDGFVARLSELLKRFDVWDLHYFPLYEPERAKVGAWTPGVPSDRFVEVKWDASKVLKAGQWQLAMQFEQGEHGIDIAWMEVRLDGKVLKRAELNGFAGGGHRNNGMAVTVPKDGQVEVVASIRGSGGSDTRGSVFAIREDRPDFISIRP